MIWTQQLLIKIHTCTSTTKEFLNTLRNRSGNILRCLYFAKSDSKAEIVKTKNK